MEWEEEEELKRARMSLEEGNAEKNDVNPVGKNEAHKLELPGFGAWPACPISIRSKT
jgi:hypothetical protein